MTKGLFAVAAVALFAAACVSALETVHAPTVIPWSRAEELILAGEVRGIDRIATGEVRLLLRDGRRLIAAEPEASEASRVIERCGEPCAEMTVR